MLKQTDNYQTFKHLNDMDPLLRRIQRDSVPNDDFDSINSISEFCYVLTGPIVLTIVVIAIIIILF